MGKKTKGWIEGTNLNNSPNSQGTLFQGGNAHIAPEHRYNKGYTPERMAAVQKAARWVGPGIAGDYDYPRERRGKVRAQETVARSTVPVEDLKGTSIQVLHPGLFPHRTGIKDGSDGVYQHRTERTIPGYIIVRECSEHRGTLIHEIGHHVSRMSGSESSSYDTPAKRGAEEGFADHYADKHFRLAKGQSTNDLKGRSPYRPYDNQVTDHAGILRPEQFRDAYNAARPHESRTPNLLDRHVEGLTERALDETARTRHSPPLPGLEMGRL